MIRRLDGISLIIIYLAISSVTVNMLLDDLVPIKNNTPRPPQPLTPPHPQPRQEKDNSIVSNY